MQHFAFWFYLLSLFISFLSFFTSLIALPVRRVIWLKYYTNLLGLFFIILLTLTARSFVIFYTESISVFIYSFFRFLISFETSFLFIVSFLLLLNSANIKITIKILYMFITGGVFLFITSCLISIKNDVFIYKIGLSVFIAIFILLFGLTVYFRKLIFSKSNIKKKILLSLIICAAIMLVVELAELYFRKGSFLFERYIPSGPLSYSAYCFLISTINLVYCIDKIKRKKSGYSFIDAIPDNFVSDYKLTGRETEIILYLLNAYSHKDIARFLGTSFRTVNTHTYNIYRKCDVSSLLDLINLINDYE